MLVANIHSVWRPMTSIVEDAPLALCDRRSVSASQMLPCDKVHSTHLGEGYYIHAEPNHRWYWLSKQTPSEPVVFVSWDPDRAGETAGKTQF
jgi:hypothetical protein